MYGEAYWCATCLTEIGTWRPDYDSHRTSCNWLTKPYKADPSLGGYAAMQRLYDYWEGRSALGIPYVWVVDREPARSESLLDLLEESPPGDSNPD
jgi:hypothetical protein